MLNFPSLLLLLFCGLGSAAIWRRTRFRAAARGIARQEGSFWSELAASLFDVEEAPAGARIEIALSAIARKLGLRGAIVTRHDRNHCAVVAVHADGISARGLEAGTILARNSLFCGSVSAATPTLVIDYASVSEWRRHPAIRERGWETCVAVSCGDGLVVSFFDSRPRSAPFTRSDRLLVEQLAPWIASLVAEVGQGTRGELPVLDTAREI